MEAVQTVGYPQDNPPATPDEVWAILREVSISQKEAAIERKETERLIKESQKETGRLIDELRKSQQEQKDEFNKKFGKFTSRLGEIIESMVAPNLRNKFMELGLNFLSAARNIEVNDYENNIHFEVDIKLENGDKVMLIEVKTKPTTEDVKEHIERLDKMRKYADLRGDKRTFLGAVAGVVMTTNVKEYILKQGFFAIEPSGETFNITPPDGKPKEW